MESFKVIIEDGIAEIITIKAIIGDTVNDAITIETRLMTDDTKLMALLDIDGIDIAKSFTRLNLSANSRVSRL